MSVGSVKKVDGVCVTRCPADLPERETERGRIAPTKMVVPAGGRGGPRAYRVQVGMEGHARYPWWPVLGACEVE